MNTFDAAIELAVYHAFLRLPKERLPKAPFMLNSWTRVNDDSWFDLLRAEAQAAVDHLEGRQAQPQPRQRTGALLAEMQHLKPLLSERRDAA